MTRVGLGTLMTLMLLGGVVPARQAPVRSAPLGIIGGRLVDAERGGPIRKAQVRLVSTTPRMTRPQPPMNRDVLRFRTCPRRSTR